MPSIFTQVLQQITDPSITRSVVTPDQVQRDLDALQAELAALPVDGGFSSLLRRTALMAQINNKQNQLRTSQQQLNPNNGITPPAAPAPTLGPRDTTPKVGIDALKILLPKY